MQVVTPEFVKGKKVLLRYDIDVALGKGTGDRLQVTEDFKLKAGLETLKLCLENAEQVILMGHLGRPEGRVVPELSVEPIRQWFSEQGYAADLESGKLKILENLRFDPREEAADLGFAKELAQTGEVYVNESFSAYHRGASTTVLPTLLPHSAGLRFAEEVRVLTTVRENPKKPLVAIMGGAKVKDKLPVINALAQEADVVLVGGKLASDPTLTSTIVERNVVVGELNEAGTDINSETVGAWRNWISKAALIVWNGPLGKFEEPENDATGKVLRMVLDSGAEVVMGGGDSVAALNQYGLLKEAEEKAFVSVGGGAMLKFLADGILSTIQALV
ncbi:MAG: phosphoglycerate kinase [Candidatus Daviesbacteria bacterium]|nr:phosphoglycerate kinase [Candidatus Daviesbacteria bacterium]